MKMESGFVISINDSCRIIKNQLNHDIYPLERAAAEAMLQVFRRALAQHNTRRHKITIYARDNQAGVLCNGSFVWRWKLRKYSTPLLETLRDIQAQLDYHFAQYINGMPLN